MGIIQYFRKTRADWVSENPRLAPGEPTVELDTLRTKIGNESWDLWSALGYLDAFHVISGITASVTQAQGNGPLTAQINQVSTVGSDGDTVTLTAAVAGEFQVVMNNGANAMRIYPASGDDLGAGVDAKLTIDLAAGSMAIFFCYDATNWRGFVLTMET
jgi:hypothetical protein